MFARCAATFDAHQTLLSPCKHLWTTSTCQYLPSVLHTSTQWCDYWHTSTKDGQRQIQHNHQAQYHGLSLSWGSHNSFAATFFLLPVATWQGNSLHVGTLLCSNSWIQVGHRLATGFGTQFTGIAITISCWSIIASELDRRQEMHLPDVEMQHLLRMILRSNP